MLAPDQILGQASKPSKKGHPKSSDILSLLTPEEVIQLGKQYAGLESPIDISFHILTEAILPPMEWVNFEKSPKRMKISNSGTTAILSAKWHGPRPYLTKGPLAGCYVFSQLHFHWGRHFEEGSEHTMNGQSLPLEVHLMFFKNTYMTQEDAMKKIDGTVTVAYLFTLQEKDNEHLHSLTSALHEIQDPLTSYHLELLPLTHFLHIFTDDYFMYWGNVVERSILWMISRKPLGISLRQLSLFHSMTGTNDVPISKNFRSTKEVNRRIVFHVNPSKNKHSLLYSLQHEISKMDNTKPLHLKTSEIIVRNLELQNPLGKGDEFLKEHKICINISKEEVLEKKRWPANDVNNIDSLNKISRAIVENFNNSDLDNLPKENERTNNIDSLQSTTPIGSNTKLDIRTKSQIKFQLATALLNLEKEEGNDYSLLENYLKNKFESTEFEQCYDVSDSRGAEDMILPSVRSLQMNCNLYERDDILAIKEKSKSDTHCLKGFPEPVIESDSEKNSVGESNKSGWSLNTLPDREEKSECEEESRHVSPERPKTSSVLLSSKQHSVEEGGFQKWPLLQKKSKLETEVSRKSSVSSAQYKKLSAQRSKHKISTSANLKVTGQTVESARAKIRSTLRESMSKLSKLRGDKAELSKQRKSGSKSRPAWRY